MAQSGNEILKQILGVCTQINQKLAGKSPDGSGEHGKKGDIGTGPLSGMFGKKIDTKKIKDASNVIKNIFESIINFNKVKINTRKIDATSKALKGLFNTIIYIGRSRKIVINAMRMFDMLATSLAVMVRFAKAMTTLLLTIGFSIVAIAGGISLAGVLLGTRGKPLATLGIIIGVLVGLTMTMVLMGKFEKKIKDGTSTAKTMGIALALIAGGLFLFVVTISSIGKILGMASGAKNMIIGMTAALGIIVVMGLVFYGLGKIARPIILGSLTASAMGIGLALLGFGLERFAKSAKTITGLGDDETATRKSGKQRGKFGQMMAAIGPGLGVMGIMIVTSALLFALLGAPGVSQFIMLGALTATTIGAGLWVFSIGLTHFAKSAKTITSLGDDQNATKKYGKEKGKFGQMMAAIGPGLGVMGIMIVTSALLFSALGIAAVLIIPGAAAIAVMSGSLILLAGATKKVMEISSSIKTPNVKDTISEMVSGLIGGLVGGLSEGLTGTRVTNAKDLSFRGVLKLTRGIILLRKISKMISMFAKSLTAFAELDNMKVIESYDKETGKPRFGDSINIKNVGKTITSTLKTFLEGLIAGTTELRIGQARKIKQMGRALTGKRGILRAVIEFASVLKTFAQFGSEGKIGYVEMIPDGVDEDGNAKFKQIPRIVLITEVTGTITKSFSDFAEGISTGVDGISKRHRKKILAMSEALMGKKRSKIGRLFASDKPGLLEPINAFSETLITYAKFGKDGMILSPEGKAVSIDDIVKNIVRSISSFSSKLSVAMEAADASDAKKASKEMEKFSGFITQLSTLSDATKNLEKSADSITILAESVGTLSAALTNLNIEKLEGIASLGDKKTKFSIQKVAGNIADKAVTIQSRINETKAEREIRKDNKQIEQFIEEKEKEATKVVKETEEMKKPLIDVKELSQAIGLTVSSAFKNGQFTFEFANDKSGVLNFS